MTQLVDGADGVRAVRRSLRLPWLVTAAFWLAFVALVLWDSGPLRAVVYGVVLPLVMVGSRAWRARRVQRALAALPGSTPFPGRLVLPGHRRLLPRWSASSACAGLAIGVRGVSLAPPPAGRDAHVGLLWDDVDRLEVEERRHDPLLVVVAGGEPVIALVATGRRDEIVTRLEAELRRAELRRDTDPVAAPSRA